jgi:hypothetical protein
LAARLAIGALRGEWNPEIVDLAYALTPEGRNEVRAEMGLSPEFPPSRREGAEDPPADADDPRDKAETQEEGQGEAADAPEDGDLLDDGQEEGEGGPLLNIDEAELDEIEALNAVDSEIPEEFRPEADEDGTPLYGPDTLYGASLLGLGASLDSLAGNHGSATGSRRTSPSFSRE